MARDLIRTPALHHQHRPGAGIGHTVAAQWRDSRRGRAYRGGTCLSVSLCIHTTPVLSIPRRYTCPSSVPLWLRSAVSCATPLHPSLLRLSFPIIILPPDAPVQGIYLSTDYGVAWSFCSAAPAWRRSALGHKLRAVLVCQVDMELASRAGSADRGAAAATRWEVPEGLELRL